MDDQVKQDQKRAAEIGEKIRKVGALALIHRACVWFFEEYEMLSGPRFTDLAVVPFLA
jgi:hypothetical protein